MGKATYFRYFLKSAPSVIGWKLFHHKKNLKKFAGAKNISIESTSDILASFIDSKKPFSAIRFGAVEISCLNNCEKIDLGFKKKFKEPVKDSMKRNAGFYPSQDESLKEYGRLFFEEARSNDVLGISGVHMEEYFFKKLMPNAKIALYEGFEPLHGSWIKHLEGKKVLVISPFDEEIKAQYAKKDLLFPDGSDVLPNFTLLTIKAPMTMALEEGQDKSFFDSLKKIEDEMGEIDFDIALIGAGAYGSFLALYAKKLGKQGIQTGGATPTLFGIIGHRWEKREHVSKYINSNWIRPYSKPKGFETVENGAYW